MQPQVPSAIDPNADVNEFIRQRAHEGETKELDEFRLPYPNQGLGNIGPSSVTSPPITKRRADIIRPGYLIAGYWVHPTGHPLFVAKVKRLFQDQHERATWIRIRWYNTPKLGGVYTLDRNANNEENFALTPVDGLSPWHLVHWHPEDAERKDHVFTTRHQLTNTLLKLARVDIRLQSIPGRGLLGD